MYSTVLKSSVYLTSVMLVIQSNALMNESWEVVTVQNGSIRGELKTNTLFSESDYYAFHAVPYADPPLGTLRFKLPERLEAEEEEDVSGTSTVKCRQFSFIEEEMIGRLSDVHWDDGNFQLEGLQLPKVRKWCS